MRVLITGGGTGGHLYPALTVAGILRKKDPDGEILFVGSRDGLEKKVVPAQGYPFWEITTARWPRRFSLDLFSFSLALGKGYLEGLRIIRKFRPQVVFATGGYVSVPVALAAATLKVPLFLHEQNSVPGLANVFLAHWAEAVFTTFPISPKSIPAKKLVHTGLPVREKVLKVTRDQGVRYFELDPKLPTVLVTGGSRGAQRINEVMLEVYQTITRQKTPLSRIQFIHLTGRDNYSSFCQKIGERGIEQGKIGKLIVRPYLEEMEYALAAADLVISRAGAATLSELLVRGLPSILIPYPYAAENHQHYNALFLKEKKAAVVISEKYLTPEVLLRKMEKILLNPSLREEMGSQAKKLAKPDAGEKIVEFLMRSRF
ncbi:MAG: UDP-N-acetylglucosamine--N-acetylmuramyl-(pentapeptide) pyrophosphoryl-undecaprenol N-acetylglucosamine transferase [Thermoanaerobacterales bacterium 50_218]|nr:MAG: UDP-N-acetylglucosamine--N-acetylmuramyl-(pentapeptide) pyrophosphoryl-undecaprenol N-acetylglucosamine transferase [Thermoanaerobacterales bacterium 50_218]HAA90414.1 undecaprenyldiphospho-muramoylpentapeptide beta-N-acetylglucosaminyltransferase [Peptococcaceae bacterium]